MKMKENRKQVKQQFVSRMNRVIDPMVGKPFKKCAPKEINPSYVQRVNVLCYDSKTTRDVKTVEVNKGKWAYVMSAEWRITYNENDVKGFDLIYGIWKPLNSSFGLIVNGYKIDRIPFVAHGVLHRLWNKGYYKLNVERFLYGEVTFVIPMIFHLLQNGNMFPLQYVHGMYIECDLAPRKKYESAVPLKMECIFTYLASEDYSVDSMFAIYCHDWRPKVLYSLNEEHTIQIHDIFSGISAGLFFVFIKDGVIVKDRSLLKQATYFVGDLQVAHIEDGDASYGRCLHFESNDYVSAISLDHVQPILFPVEVWAIIFGFVENPTSLIESCKYLYKISHHAIVKQVSRKKFDCLSGWYYLPFTDTKCGANIIPDTLNISEMHNQVLKLRLNRKVSGVSIVMLNRHLNIVQTMNGMMGLRYQD